MGAPPADAPAGAPAAAPKAPKTALEKDMDKVNAALRKLRTSVKDATKNDTSLTYVSAIRDGLTAASNEIPAFAADQPEADRPKFIAGFQAKIKDTLGDVDKLEAALKANDNDGAAKLVAQLATDERAGHKTYRKPEDK